MGNDQKPGCSWSMVTAIPQFENFVIPLTTLQDLVRVASHQIM